MSLKPTPASARPPAFTIIEVLVSSVVLALIILLVLSMVNQIGGVYRSTSGKAQAFQAARTAFESLTRKISQATLATYLAYDDPNTPTRYLRQSELHFICGPSSELIPSSQGAVSDAIFFQAPEGMTRVSAHRRLHDLVNSLGYYVRFGTNDDMPAFVRTALGANSTARYRLVEFFQPAEDLTVYGQSSGTDWFTNGLSSATPSAHAIATNVVALILTPKVPPPGGGEPVAVADGRYDSRDQAGATPQPVNANQLPPVIGITLVAIDEESAQRWVSSGGTSELTIPAFDNPANLEADLETLTAQFLTRKTNYRIFRTDVPIKSAKWSE